MQVATEKLKKRWEAERAAAEAEKEAKLAALKKTKEEEHAAKKAKEKEEREATEKKVEGTAKEGQIEVEVIKEAKDQDGKTDGKDAKRDEKKEEKKEQKKDEKPDVSTLEATARGYELDAEWTREGVEEVLATVGVQCGYNTDVSPIHLFGLILHTLFRALPFKASVVQRRNLAN